MNFFKSMLSDDPEPENMDNHQKSNSDYGPNHQQTETADAESTDLNSTSSGEISGSISGGGLWNFGDLVKTLTTKSESVLETYRRDLKEFGSGLRKESDLFREVANRAVKDLPSSIEVGASAIDGVLKSTVDIISQGKDVLLEPSNADDFDTSPVQNPRVYSRFDSQLNAIQSDATTYCDDPEDLDGYNKWKLGFVLSDRESEIEKLIGDNRSIEAIHKKVVPNQVDDASFWCRYFYRVHKLKHQEDTRAHFVRRSLTVDDEEDLSWDVDDEEETNSPEIETKQDSTDRSKPVTSNAVEDDRTNNSDASSVNINNVPKMDQTHDEKNSVEELKLGGGGEFDHQKVESVVKTDENLDCNKNSGKALQADEDLEWDEIGDVGEDDEKHVVRGETTKKGELLKRVNIVEDGEDLSWDIEDDDEPVKTSSMK